MRIVIAGGTGFLGSALVQAFRRESHQVLVLTRRPRRGDDVQWSPEKSVGTGPTLWARIFEDIDAVINLSGEGIADRRWTRARKNAILQSRIKTTRAIVTAIKEAHHAPKALINASAIGIYGPHGDEPVTEETAPGSDFLASVCKTWESEAREAASATRVVLLRSGLVMAAEGGALPKLALPFRLFAGGRRGSGRQYMSWIHRDDWVSMVRWAIADKAVSGPLNLTAPEPVTNAELARTLGRVLHRPAIIPAPAFALRLAVGEMADAMLLSGQRVLPRKAQSGGFEFRYPALEPALRGIYV
jgi:uncharacterized protein (TIGR01777 family)